MAGDGLGTRMGGPHSPVYIGKQNTKRTTAHPTNQPSTRPPNQPINRSTHALSTYLSAGKARRR